VVFKYSKKPKRKSIFFKNDLIIFIMKRTITTLLFLGTTILCFSQQELQYTQFMYNKLALNPGYAGSHNSACFTGLYRNQWIGLEGAPKTQLLSFDTPVLDKRVGIGLTINRTTIGISEKLTLEGNYAYRIPIGKGHLGIGIQASVRYIGSNYADSRLVATQSISSDGGIPVGDQSAYVPNFGAGLYFSSDKFYVGLSVPRFLENSIDFNTFSGVLGKEVPHIYFMTGLLLGANKNLKFQPQVLLKYAPNTPFAADLNLNVIMIEKLTLGLTYRLGGSSLTGSGESIDLLVAFQATEQLLFGFSYDVTLSEIKDYNSGSIEAVIRYCLPSKGKDVVNPRFF
jgi:type IX secretion system PorP/SprF family membrane protein